MLAGKNVMRRAAGALAIAVGALAMTGSTASAASSVPDILNGSANSQALHINVKLPTLNELVAALNAVGGDTLPDLPDLSDLPVDLGQEIDIIVSKTGGVVVRADEDLPDGSSGFATTLDVTGLDLLEGQNLLDLNQSVSTSCRNASCAGEVDTTPLNKIELPAGIGFIELQKGLSESLTWTETNNEAHLAKVHLGALFDEGGLLDLLGPTMDDLSKLLNDNVLPQVNEVLVSLDSTIRDLLVDDAEAIYDAIVTRVGRPGEGFEDIDLRKSDLLDLRVLGSHSFVEPYTANDATGLMAHTDAGIADVDVLGGWTTIDAATMKATSKANGTASGTDADSEAKVVGLNVGEAFGLDPDIAFLADPNNLIKAIDSQLGGVLPDDIVTDLGDAADLVYSVAGLEVINPKTYKNEDPTSAHAWAEAGASPFKIVVAPQLPTLDSVLENLPTAGNIVPDRDKLEYVKTGIELTVEFPQGDTRVSIGDVKEEVFEKPGRTGVGMQWIAALAMLSGAVLVRRFATVK